MSKIRIKSFYHLKYHFFLLGTKRNLTGLSAATKSKSSLFASPDAVDGKVGVTNSGKGMTSFIERKKHKFDPAN